MGRRKKSIAKSNATAVPISDDDDEMLYADDENQRPTTPSLPAGPYNGPPIDLKGIEPILRDPTKTIATTSTQKDRIFVWEVDETLLIFHSLLNGAFNSGFNDDSAECQRRRERCVSLGLQIEHCVFSVADEHLFYGQLEDCDQVHVDDLTVDDNGINLTDYAFSKDGFHESKFVSEITAGIRGLEWTRKLAYRYRRVREIYDRHKVDPGNLLPDPLKIQLQPTLREIDALTENWTTLSRKIVAKISDRGEGTTNVIVTSTPLVLTLAKVLLFGFGQHFNVKSIYSAVKTGKQAVFERLKSVYGENSTYIVVGTGQREDEAAKMMGWSFWRITDKKDLIALESALDQGLL